MKIRYLVAFLAIGLVVLILTGKGKRPGVPRGGGKISWLTDLSPALTKAKETGRPIMIDFYADWCGPCKMLDAETYSDDRVAHASTNLVMVRIDVDQNQILAREYRVESIPTIVVLSAEGKEMQREIGFMGVGPMLTMMEHATARK